MGAVTKVSPWPGFIYLNLIQQQQQQRVSENEIHAKFLYAQGLGKQMLKRRNE